MKEGLENSGNANIPQRPTNDEHLKEVTDVAKGINLPGHIMYDENGARRVFFGKKVPKSFVSGKPNRLSKPEEQDKKDGK